MTRQVFMVEEKWPGLSPKLRRSLSQVDLDAPYLLKIRSVCVKLKLKALSPIYEGEIWAHIGIPSKKVAIYSRPIYDTKRIAAEREQWKALGWKLIFVMPHAVEATAEEDLVKQLDLALKEMGK